MKKEMTQEQRKFIDSLRRFLAENKIKNNELAREIKKSKGTISHWLNCDYPIPESCVLTIKAFMSGHFKPKPQNMFQSLDEEQFNTFKARLLNYIMQHPSISEKSKVEVYNALQDFQLASPTPTHTPTGEL